MRKELLWAGIIGISFGLIIGFGTWRVRSSLKPKEDGKPTPTPQVVGQPKITIDKPENRSVVTSDLITVTGITKPSSWLVFSGEKEDYILESDGAGAFSKDIDLISGVNQIKVTSFNTAGDMISQEILVVYSSLFVTATGSPQSSTDEAGISQKVAQKLTQAKSQPKAYLGTVTDIADSTIQIKNAESQIEQIAISASGISVVNTKGTNNKVLKLTDIAIGDFIVAMGYVNGNEVLGAQRIIVTDPVTDIKMDAIIAKVTKVTTKGLSLTTLKDNQEISITPDKNTDIISFSGYKEKNIKLSDIVAEDLIIAVIDNSGNTPKVSSIFDIVQSQN